MFTLAPVAAYQHRLVFDLYPTKERDPLLALMRDKEQAEQQAAQAVQDALGEFIGRMARGASGRGGDGTAPPLAARRRWSRAPRAAPPSAPPRRPWRAGALPRRSRPERKIDRLVVVAIDPGHGGEDPGAIGPSGLHEKDVVLAIAHAAARPPQRQSPTCARC